MTQSDVPCRHAAIQTVHDLPEAIVRRFRDAPDSFLWHPEAEPVKISPTSVIVRLEWSWGSQTVPVALKRYRPRSWWKAFCERFRPSRAVRAWRLGHELLARGIRTARPLLACRLDPWHGPSASYLVTEWIEGAENVHLWGWRRAADPPARRLRWAARCATSLGQLLGRMHAQGVSHRDLKAANLLVRETGDDVETWLIDPDGARIVRRLSPRRRAADLARLATSLEAHPWITPAVCYRFLVAYAGEFPDGQIDPKRLWRDVQRRAARHVRRKRRRGDEVL